MKIGDLIPTHNILRNPETIIQLSEVVKTGCAGKVKLIRFEDGNLFVHDGHHRLCAMMLSDHVFLQESECDIEDMCYIEYTMSNPRNGWFTPFDPITECRVADFSLHKMNAQSLWENRKKNRVNSLDFHETLCKMKKDYAEKRFVKNMRELLSCTLSIISSDMDLTNYKKFML